MRRPLRGQGLLEGEPGRLPHFLGLHGQGRVARREQVAQVEVDVLGPVAAGRDRMDVEVEDDRAERRFEDGDSRFFQRLAPGGVEDGSVASLDVAAGLEPAVEAAVVDEEEGLSVGARDDGAAGDVVVAPG